MIFFGFYEILINFFNILIAELFLIISIKLISIQSMISTKDEDIEALLGKINIKALNQKCSSGHKKEKFCANKDCLFDALCCSEENCKACYDDHFGCLFGWLSQITKRMESRLGIQKKFVRGIINIENNLMKQLFAGRKEMIKSNNLWKLDERLSNIIKQIYHQNSSKDLTGADMNYLFTYQLFSKKMEDLADQYLKTYKAEGESRIHVLSSYRQILFDDIFVDKRKNFDSKILLARQTEKVNYLLKQLGNPSSLKLLFRASQHDFSASKFHQLCNGYCTTVTIIRTQFDKTIAAYTPMPWSSSLGLFADVSKSSFILQLELKQKMTLINPKAAIYCDPNIGPIFGGDGFRIIYDLRIANNCNVVNCSTNFPSCYNFGQKYACNSSAWMALTGSSNRQFKVLEYEVFQVVK